MTWRVVVIENRANLVAILSSGKMATRFAKYT